MAKAGTQKRKLTKKQKDFADEYINTGNKTQSALKTYDTKDYKTASVIGHENLEKPRVREYIESKAQRAAEITYDIAENGDGDGVRLSAAKDIQDRAGLKPIEKSQSVSYNVDLSNKTYVVGITEKVIAQMRDDELERNA